MKIAGDSVYVVVGSVGQALVSLLLAAATARLLGPSGRGEVYYVLQASSLAGLTAAMGLGSAMQRQRAAGEATLAHTLRLARVHGAIVAAVVTVAALVLAHLPGMPLPAVLREHAGLFAVLTVTNSALLLYGGIFALRERGFRDTSLTALTALAATLLIVLACPALPPGAWTLVVLVGYALPMACRVLWFDARLSHDRGGDRAPARAPLYGSIFGESLMLFAGNVVVMLLLRVDTFMLERLRGIAEVGTYSLATGLAEMVLWMPSALGTVLFARMPAASPAERDAVTPMISRRTLLATAVLCAALAIAAAPLVRLLAGPRFEPAIAALRLLLPGLLGMSVSYVLYNFLASARRTGTAVLCFLAGVVLNVVLNLQLIPAYGQNGAAIASSIAYLATAALLIYNAGAVLGQRNAAFVVATTADLRAIRGAVRAVGQSRRGRRT